MVRSIQKKTATQLFHLHITLQNMFILCGSFSMRNIEASRTYYYIEARYAIHLPINTQHSYNPTKSRDQFAASSIFSLPPISASFT